MEEDRSRVCEVNQKQMKKFEDDMKARRSKIFEEIKAQGPLPDEVLKVKMDVSWIICYSLLTRQESASKSHIDEEVMLELKHNLDLLIIFA